MNYPLISEYIEAIKAAEDNLNQLNHLRPVLNGDGQPVMSSGNFAVVFKMKDEQTGELHAIKCFLKEQEGRAEAYKEIAKELENVSSTFLTPIKYYEHELFVDSKATDDIEFPVLLMDWVEGVPLDKYVRENIDDSYELELLTWNFKLMATWLLEQPFAHGDLKPDNIIVRDDGTMVLVDYDGMYVPVMEGQCARELGSPDFRHPQRTEQDFDKRIDDFPIVSIALSLKAIALEPELLERYGAKDRLLFSEADYRELGNCRFVKDYFPSQSPELDILYALFLMIYRDMKQPENTMFSILDAVICQPEINKDNFANEWIDKYGAKYSADRKRLLKGPNINKYYILEGTDVIESYAFKECGNLQSIVIPNSVTTIEGRAFCGCRNLQTVVIPNSVTHIKYCAFLNCESLQSIVIPESVTKISDDAFLSCSNLQSIVVAKENKKYDSRNNCNAIIETVSNKLIIGCATTQIPDTVTQIGSYAFEGSGLQSIVIPESIINIGNGVFSKCDNLQSIIVANGNKEYDSRDNCNAIIETNSNKLVASCITTRIPDSVTNIGYSAFSGSNIQSIVIPDSVVIIGGYAFHNCSFMQSIAIPDSVKKIGEYAFEGCSSLQSVKLPCSIEKFENRIFKECGSLQSIVIPDSVTTIGAEAFKGCGKISILKIGPNVCRIDDTTFIGCQNIHFQVSEKNLYYSSNNGHLFSKDGKVLLKAANYKIQRLSDMVEIIGEQAFESCNTTQKVTAPGCKEIGNLAFENCSALQEIILPNCTDINKEAFKNCSALEHVEITSAKVICKSVFSGCSSLNTLYLPDTVTSIPESFPKNCKIVVSESNPLFYTINGSLYSKKYKTLLHAYTANNTEFIIPKGTKRIGKNSLSGRNLKDIHIPETVQSIGFWAFSNNPIQKFVLPNSVIEVKEGAFADCPIEQITMPGLRHLDLGDYMDCEKLKTIVAPNVTSFSGLKILHFGKKIRLNLYLSNFMTNMKYDGDNYYESILSLHKEKQIDNNVAKYVATVIPNPCYDGGYQFIHFGYPEEKY